MSQTILYNIVVWIAILVAILFIALIFFTSKGDAMSSGGSVRTSYKGRTTTEDKIAKMTLSFAALFVGLMLLLDFISPRGDGRIAPSAGQTPPPVPANTGSEIPESATRPAPANSAVPAPKLEPVEAPPFAPKDAAGNPTVTP